MHQWTGGGVCRHASARPQLRLDFMLFCDLDLFAPVPDATTHCRFRNTLVKGGVHDDLLAGVCRQIGDHGPKRWNVPPAPAAIPVRHASAAGQERREAYARLQNEIQRPCPLGRGKLHRQAPQRAPANRAGSPVNIMVKGANTQAGIGR
ncbi:MAG: transposase [Rhodobacteraceae bacterium]|nr:transposase [Paracoccaceae bacterium]